MPRTVSISRTYGPNALGRLGQALQVGGQTVNDVFQKINDFKMNDELAKYLSSSESPDVAPVWNPANYTLGGDATADVIEGPPKEPMFAQASEPKSVTKGRKAAFDSASALAQAPQETMSDAAPEGPVSDVNPLLSQASEGTAQIPNASKYNLANVDIAQPAESQAGVSPFMQKLRYQMASDHLKQQMGDEEYNKELQKVQGVVQILMKYGHPEQALPFMLKHLEMLQRDKGYDTQLLRSIYAEGMKNARQETELGFKGKEGEANRGNTLKIATMNLGGRKELKEMDIAAQKELAELKARLAGEKDSKKRADTAIDQITGSKNINSVLGQANRRISVLDDVLNAINGGKEGDYHFTPQATTEIASALASSYQQGSRTAFELIKKIIPKSSWSDTSSWIQYITNAPRDVLTSGWVNELQAMSTRQRNQWALKRQEYANPVLENLDPEDRARVERSVAHIGVAPLAEATGSGGASAQQQQAIEWLRKNPNDPKAPAVRAKLQREGVKF